MEGHRKALGIIYVISAILQTLIMLVISLFISTVFSFIIDQADHDDLRFLQFIMNAFEYVPALVILIFSLPTLIAGIGLLTNQSWAMILSLIVGCLKLFSFPIGTSIGIYAIWVYAEHNKNEKVNPPQVNA